MIQSLKRPVQSRRLKRPSKAFKQRYAPLMTGLDPKPPVAVNEQEAPVPAPIPTPEIHAVIPYVGIALTGAVDVEQVGRDHIIHLEGGKGIRLNNLSGKDGIDGISLNSANIQDDGHLLLEYSDERIADLGLIVGKDGIDGVGVKTMQVTDKNLIVGLTNDQIIDVGRIVGKDGEKGKNGVGFRGKRGLRGLRGKRGLLGKKGDPGEPAEPQEIIVNQVADQKIELDFNRQTRRLRITVGEKTSFIVIPSGGGGGLSTVATDATLTGDGTQAGPLSVVGGGTVETDASISGDGAAATPLSVVDSEVDHLLIANKGANTHVQIDNHLGSMANPHSVTAAQASADPAGTAATGDTAHLTDFVHGDIALNTTHRGLTNNPHLVTAGQAGADPSGSAATVQGNLDTHEALSDIHVAHSGVTLTAGVGLSGGGDIAANRTFDLEDTAVTLGSYTYASLTIDQQGRITAASSGSAPAVDSVFSRTGAVVAAINDYTWAQINKTVSDLADLATKSHTSLTDKGTNTHAQIDTHIADTVNPHATDLGNLGSGTLAELNALITNANVDDSGDPRDPNAHAIEHVDGTDDIQAAGAAQKGLLTSVAQTIGGVKTFNANILPIGSIIFQTGATDLDLATNGARFLPHFLRQAAEPTPAAGELMMWSDSDNDKVRLVFNDATVGVVSVQLK